MAGEGDYPQAANYAHSRQKRVNDQLALIRNFVGQTLVPFFDELKEVQTGRELATKLYHFLIANGVTDRLNNWQNYQADQGNLILLGNPNRFGLPSVRSLRSTF
ncbi:MAG: hypothetical protein ACLSH6_08825 [Limosilactobacillus pontis]